MLDAESMVKAGIEHVKRQQPSEIIFDFSRPGVGAGNDATQAILKAIDPQGELSDSSQCFVAGRFVYDAQHFGNGYMAQPDATRPGITILIKAVKTAEV